jgi:hypothetical protein
MGACAATWVGATTTRTDVRWEEQHPQGAAQVRSHACSDLDRPTDVHACKKISVHTA